MADCLTARELYDEYMVLRHVAGLEPFLVPFSDAGTAAQRVWSQFAARFRVPRGGVCEPADEYWREDELVAARERLALISRISDVLPPAP